MGEQVEQRRSERLRLGIPIRVMGVNLGRREFCEDTRTVVVNGAGARIKITNEVAPNSTLRIINLENYKEADFRVVGPTLLEGSEVAEWGVEYIERHHNIWDIDFPKPISSEEAAGALLECRACHKQALRSVTIMELEALNSTGIVALTCDHCRKLTYWICADLDRRPRELPPSDLVAPRVEPRATEGAEKRKAKRLGMKMPILVRNSRGEEEITKTENISKGGVAVSLSMNLAVGDQVTVVCPYSAQSQNFERKAQVRQRTSIVFNAQRLYGLGYCD